MQLIECFQAIYMQRAGYELRLESCFRIGSCGCTCQCDRMGVRIGVVLNHGSRGEPAVVEPADLSKHYVQWSAAAAAGAAASLSSINEEVL